MGEVTGPAAAPPTIPELAAELTALGVRRILTFAWRDLDDPDAGGSEVHADHFMRRWAAAGLDVTHRTSFARGLPHRARRNGYAVQRYGSRYSVFPRAVAHTITHPGSYDALVEIWNGVPWFGPVWCRKPNITFLHHVHGPMWDQIMPRPLAGLGRALETRLAPPFYRRTQVVTPSEGTREELLGLGFRPDRVTAVPNGVEDEFTPGGERADAPTVLSVARLAPVKRQDELIEQMVVARRSVPDLRLVIVGDGPLRPELEARIARHDAASWITLAGRVAHDQLVEWYRRAWLVASASIAEGWGLALTEGAACGTPGVATDIRGHRDSVVDGTTGVLAPLERLGAATADLLNDPARLASMGAACLARSQQLTWDESGRVVLQVLRCQVLRSRG